MTRRVVITGVGWVTPLGCDVDAVWQRLLAGERAAAPIRRFDAETFATNFAAEVRDFNLADMAPHLRNVGEVSLGTRFALGAAAVAFRDAGIRPGSIVPERFGMYFGCGEGSLDLEAFAATNLAAWNPDSRTVDGPTWASTALARMSPVREIEQEPNLPLQHLADAFHCRGPAFNCMTACAAGTQAVGEAAEIIRRGDADAMLTGGAHSMIHPLGMTGFIRLTAMSTRRDDPAGSCRPFDATRDGFVMGEGAGVLVLEGLDHALARGATPLAEVAGYGSSADAFRITDIQPQGAGAQAAIRQALRQAGIDPQRRDDRGRPPVHYISAHGTGTQENDAIETQAVKAVFGDLAPDIPFTSVKSMLGHLIQAAGAVELITCIQAIRTGMIPPTANLSTPDPACDLDHVPHTARDTRDRGGVDVCLSNSFGFGGQNTTICVRRYLP